MRSNLHKDDIKNFTSYAKMFLNHYLQGRAFNLEIFLGVGGGGGVQK